MTTRLLLRSPLLWIGLLSLAFLTFARVYSTRAVTRAAYGPVSLGSVYDRVLIKYEPYMRSSFQAGQDRIPSPLHGVKPPPGHCGYTVTGIPGYRGTLNAYAVTLTYQVLIAADILFFATLFAVPFLRRAAARRPLHQASLPDHSPKAGPPA